MNTKVTIAVISKVAAENGKNLKTLTSLCNIPQENLGDWLKGKGEITDEQLDAMCEALAVDKKEILQMVREITPDKDKAPVKEAPVKEVPVKETPKAEEKPDIMPKPATPEDKSKAESKPKAKTKETEASNLLSMTGFPIPKSKSELKGTIINLEKNVLSALDVLKSYTMTLGETCMTLDKGDKVDARYKALLKAAEGSSDEGIALAITILKKWKK